MITKKRQMTRRIPSGWWVGYSSHQCLTGLLALGEDPEPGATWRCPACRAKWRFKPNPERKSYRPSKRKRASLADMPRAKERVRQRSRGLCEARVPGICLGRATNYHHRLPEGQGGVWAPVNLMHVCGSGTTGCHGWIEHNRGEARRLGWLVPMGGKPEEVLWRAW